MQSELSAERSAGFKLLPIIVLLCGRPLEDWVGGWEGD
jgi:hypothetical protein